MLFHKYLKAPHSLFKLRVFLYMMLPPVKSQVNATTKTCLLTTGTAVLSLIRMRPIKECLTQYADTPALSDLVHELKLEQQVQS